MKSDSFVEQYMDVLQNIEFGIVSVYKEHPELTDYQVDKAVDSLLRVYQAEVRSKAAPGLRLNDLETQVYERVKDLCEFRLGRQALDQPEGEEGDAASETLPNLTVDEIIACLKRIRLSVKRWTKDRGRQGYLWFVSQYVG